MIARILAAILALATASGAAHRLEAETLDAVKKKIHDRVSGYKTLAYKIKATGESSAQGSTLKFELDISLEYKRKGDKILSRTDQKSDQDMGNGQKTHSVSQVIYDGQFTFTFSEAMGNKSAFKQKPGPETFVSPMDAASAFKQNEKMYDLRLLPDEKVNGEDCYVIEMIMKDENMRQYAGKTVSYYSKKSGLAMKAVSHDPAGKPNNTMIMVEYKIDGDIPDDRFVFKAPSGVEVMDMTKMSAPGG